MDTDCYLVSCKPQTKPYIRYEGTFITTNCEETAEQCGCMHVARVEAGATDRKTARFVTPCTKVSQMKTLNLFYLVIY